jgi:hypothetical protein
MATMITDVPALDLLRRFRGRVVSSSPGYPEVLHLTVRDAQGGKWTFSTFDSEFSPSDPDACLGKSVVDVKLAASNTTTICFSDGSDLIVTPRPLQPGEEDDDLENWFLLTPDNQALDFGPVARWRLGRGDEPW